MVLAVPTPERRPSSRIVGIVTLLVIQIQPITSQRLPASTSQQKRPPVAWWDSSGVPVGGAWRVSGISAIIKQAHAARVQHNQLYIDTSSIHDPYSQTLTWPHFSSCPSPRSTAQRTPRHSSYWPQLHQRRDRQSRSYRNRNRLVPLPLTAASLLRTSFASEKTRNRRTPSEGFTSARRRSLTRGRNPWPDATPGKGTVSKQSTKVRKNAISSK